MARPGGGDDQGKSIQPSMWNPDAEPVYNQSGVATGQPPLFRATRKPEPMVARPDFPATETNANGVLIQANAPQTADRPWLSKIYLFVDAIETSWSVSGELGQAMTSRIWYPRNFLQGEWVIQGTMANQYEYDKLVEFVQQHQQSILQADSYRGDDYLQLYPCKFMLFKPANLQKSVYKIIPEAGINQVNKFLIYLAITFMEAGHERFRFAPAFTLRCKVLGDLWQDSKVKFDIPTPDQLNPTAIFGDLGSPSTSPIAFGSGSNSPHGSLPPNSVPGGHGGV